MFSVVWVMLFTGAHIAKTNYWFEVHHANFMFLIEPVLPLWKDLVAMLTAKRSAGVTPEVNLMITQAKKACMRGIQPGFEIQGKRHQKPTSGHTNRKGLMS